MEELSIQKKKSNWQLNRNRNINLEMAIKTMGKDKAVQGKFTGSGDDERLFFLVHNQKEYILLQIMYCMSLKCICFLYKLESLKVKDLILIKAPGRVSIHST